MAVLPRGVTIAAGAPYPRDVIGHWAEPEIQRLLDLGVVNGYPDGTFRPDGPISRAEFLKMLVVAVGGEPIRTLASPFSDTVQHWFYTLGYQEAAMRRGITSPWDSPVGVEVMYTEPDQVAVYFFRPNRGVTRAEMATFIVRAMDLGAQAEMLTGTSVFPDDESSGFVCLAHAAGVVDGAPDGKFHPSDGATRAEASVTLSRMLKALETPWEPIRGTFVRSYGTAATGAHCVRELGSGGFIIAGHKQNWGDECSDAWLVKTDPDGRVVWEKTYGSASRFDLAYSVSLAADGGYVVAGVNGSGNLGSDDGWVIKTDAAGNKVGDFIVFSSVTCDEARVAIATADGGCVAAGTKDMGQPTPFEDDKRGEALLVKLNAKGDVEWTTSLGTKARVFDMAATSAGAYIVCGDARDSRYRTHGWVAKVDGSGLGVIWQQTYADSSGYDDHIRGLALTADGGCVVTGRLGGKARLLKIDPQGVPVWDRTLGPERYGGYEGYDVIVAADGEYVIAGQKVGYGFWLAKIGADGAVKWEQVFRRSHEDRANDLTGVTGGGYAFVSEREYNQLPGGALLVKIDNQGCLFLYPSE